MTVFNRMGIPGPKPNFLFGNLLTFMRRAFFEAYREWYREYGDTYGYFEGPSAVMVTTNLDLLHEVFVKQFKKFHARKVFPVQVDPDTDENVHMFFARGERWRRLRSIVNPAFSTAKMRMMTPVINKRIDKLVSVVDNYTEKDQDFDVYDLFQRLTLDTIVDCGFGLNADALEDTEDEWLKNSRGVIKDTTKRPLLFMLGFIFPKLHSVWIMVYNILRYVSYNPVFWLEEKMGAVIKARKGKKSSRLDLLELMLNSEFDPNTDTYDIGQLGASDSVVKKRLLTNDELLAQCLLFLLAGYETTSTTLAYIIVVARQCMESCNVNGYDIPEGMIIQANVWDVHYNPDIWGEDPEKFIPERFTSEKRKLRHPMAWLPFGGGPRTCVGLRLAQLEGKMAIVRLLKKFTFVPSKRCVIPVRCVEGATIIPKDGVIVNTIPRSVPDCPRQSG
ncbi:hypothetical protein KUTeg_005498 [Tegillarca granosa]|uniref:Cytochrome P450 n=1 Tax=Tegillarca granosa TaxID=220873 RepID=A0ABQ9FJX2_TEGGR|nr:hypothetical protein KUTeg_005498 [Tegillarca granosa]